jgi:hypothetical protein
MRSEPLWRLALAGPAALVLAACLDGYPPKEPPIISPYDMSQTQRMVEMNQAGLQAAQRWSYALLPGCVLRVDVDGPDGPAPSRDIALLGHAVAVSANRERGGFQVELQPRSDPSSDAVSVLESEKWADASWSQLLLRLVQKGCMEAAASPP